MGCAADDVGLVGSASEAIVLIASGIDFKPGDNIVTNDLEFPSTVLPWIQMKEHGVEVRLVRSRDWQFTPEDVIAQMDGRTRLVAVSHVSYLSGLRLDLAPIAHTAHAHGALLLADVTQSLGVVPVAVGDYDFAVASTYKWLLGIHGGGVLYWNRTRLPRTLRRARWVGIPWIISSVKTALRRLRGSRPRSASNWACRPTRRSMPWRTAYVTCSSSAPTASARTWKRSALSSSRGCKVKVGR